MATKPSTAVAKKPGTAVMSYEDRLAALAQDSVKQEESVSSGSFISFRGGQLSYGGNACQGNKLDVVVVDNVMEFAYYEGNYDPDAPASPVCYAFGREEENMSPHVKSSSPQSVKCHDCQMNQFGTADNGKGKACKNLRRLAVIPATPLDAAAIATAEVAYTRIPVTSVKGWSTYVRGLSALEKLPPLAVVTQLGTVPDPKTQFKVTFTKLGNIPKNILGAIFEKHDVIKEEIMFPYAENATVEKTPPKKNSKVTAVRRGR